MAPRPSRRSQKMAIRRLDRELAMLSSAEVAVNAVINRLLAAFAADADNAAANNPGGGSSSSAAAAGGNSGSGNSLLPSVRTELGAEEEKELLELKKEYAELRAKMEKEMKKAKSSSPIAAWLDAGLADLSEEELRSFEAALVNVQRVVRALADDIFREAPAAASSAQGPTEDEEEE